MKSFALFFVLTLSALCGTAQTMNFEQYVGHFKKSTLPLFLSPNMKFFQYSLDGNMGERIVKEYICNDHNKDYKAAEYKYYWGSYYLYVDNYVGLVIKSKETLGDSYYDHDLVQILLMIYDTQGKQLSQTMIAQQSDMYFAECYMVNDSTIHTIQATALEQKPIKFPLNVKFDFEYFAIKEDGTVIKSIFRPTQTGTVSWNEHKQTFDMIYSNQYAGKQP